LGKGSEGSFRHTSANLQLVCDLIPRKATRAESSHLERINFVSAGVKGLACRHRTERRVCQRAGRKESTSERSSARAVRQRKQNKNESRNGASIAAGILVIVIACVVLFALVELLG